MNATDLKGDGSREMDLGGGVKIQGRILKSAHGWLAASPAEVHLVRASAHAGAASFMPAGESAYFLITGAAGAGSSSKESFILSAQFL